MNESLNLTQSGRIARQCVCCEGQNLQRSPAILMPFIAHRVFGWEPVEITEEWGLKTIRQGMAYSICNTLQCEACGHLFLDIRFDATEMTALYDGYRNETYTALREKYEPGYTQRNKLLNEGVGYTREIESFLAPYLQFPLSVLDWGGDTGKNTPFKNENNRVYVYDISDVPVVDGVIKVGKSTLSTRDYNLVVCSNVLEHIPYPVETVNEIAGIMNRKTILYIEVPCEDLFVSGAPEKELYKLKKHWHEHINFYSRQSLTSLLENCNLAILDYRLQHVEVAGKKAKVHMVACRVNDGV